MSEAEQTGTGREEIWLEKYRPQTFDEIVGQETIVERLRSYVERRDLPHMLYAGPAGVGKCTTGETPVLTDDGLFRIADVVGDTDGFAENSAGTQILTLTDSGDFEYTKPSHVFGKEADELVSISTRDGSEMTVTPEHKLLVLTQEGLEWREAGETTPGDRIVRPLSAPLPETETELDWVAEMDGDRTFVHVSTEFAERQQIPFEENLVGVKKEVVRHLRQGADIDTIAEQVETPRNTVTSVEREFRDDDLDAVSKVCSLSHLRDLDVSRETLREHVKQIQYVAPSNNTRSRPVTPPWELTPDLATLVGLAVSEARIDSGRIKFYNNDEALLETFERCLNEQFDVEPRTGEQKGVPYVAISNRTVTHYLESCFDVFDGAMGGDGIGSTLLRADEESRRAFLRAVFDAEAHVTKQGILELTQKRGARITLLSYLLAGFGIPSRRKEKRKRATNGRDRKQTYHTLYISSSSHLSQFERTVGFSIGEKESRLADATARQSNPNNDTIPTQESVAALCQHLNLDKTSYIADSWNPETPGRQRYLDGVSDLIDDATERLETIQEARERLARLEPAIDEVVSIPSQWVDRRQELEPLDMRRQVGTSTGVGTDRLLEYARGERTPYAGRVQTLLSEVTGEQVDAPVETLQSELRGIVERLDIPYERIARGLQMRGPEVSNLLTHDDHEIKSLSRFGPVTDRLDTVLSQMASIETVEHLRALNYLAECDLYLDEVERVENVDETRRVYDLTVPGTRNYVAGTVPMVMHNTTSAVTVARELYGENWQEHFLELNASDERGIDVVRDRIKSFARTSFGGVDYRIIFLDEADALTSEAQAALRRTMEQFSNNVRFILSCNYSSQIIDPIQSRCAVFRFSPLADEAVAAQVRTVAAKEDIEVTDDGVDALVYAADGDMRKAINGLQAAAVTGSVVDEEAVFEITSTARPEEIREMVTLALEGDFTAARSRLNQLITEEGIAGGDIIDQLHRSVWEFDLEDEAAVRLLDRIGEADYRITAGANERVQLEALLASLALDE